MFPRLFPSDQEWIVDINRENTMYDRIAWHVWYFWGDNDNFTKISLFSTGTKIINCNTLLPFVAVCIFQWIVNFLEKKEDVDRQQRPRSCCTYVFICMFQINKVKLSCFSFDFFFFFFECCVFLAVAFLLRYSSLLNVRTNIYRYRYRYISVHD